MLTYKYYSSNDTFTAPAGVTKVWVLAQGGGAGGNGGRNTTGAQSILSAGTSPYLIQLNVTPNTTYSITIGGGGSGGGPRTNGTANAGVGGNTTFSSLYTWYGGYQACGSSGDTTGPSGQTIDIGHTSGKDLYNYNITSGFVTSVTTVGTSSGSYEGGQSGSPGYFGSVRGVGGNGNNAGAGTNGTTATGFGASGGAGGNGVTGGSGGAGAPGQMWVIWVE